MIDVDPTMFGYAMWAATHGLVMLQQAGMLEHAPDYRTLANFHGALDAEGSGARETGQEGREEAMTAGMLDATPIPICARCANSSAS